MPSLKAHIILSNKLIFMPYSNQSSSRLNSVVTKMSTVAIYSFLCNATCSPYFQNVYTTAQQTFFIQSTFLYAYKKLYCKHLIVTDF